MNRVGPAFLKSPQFLPRLFGQRFFASGPTDARQNVFVVIVDFNGEQQLHVQGKYSDLLGRSPDFPFPGNVKPVAEMQQKLPAPLEILPTQNRIATPGAMMPLHKIVEPPFVVADDRAANQRTLKHRLWQMADIGQTTTTTAQCEWMVTGVDSIRMLWEELNAMFGTRFAPGSEITVISLCANIEPKEQQMTTLAEGEEDQIENEENVGDERTAKLMKRSDLLIPGYEFVRVANAICAQLRAAGFWADFVDPRNGRPYLRQKQRRHADPLLGHRSLVLEWDPRNTFNGLYISSKTASSAQSEDNDDDNDGPTCKIIERAEWAEMNFNGQLFTDCPPNSNEMQKILASFESVNSVNGKAADEGGHDGRGTADDLVE